MGEIQVGNRVKVEGRIQGNALRKRLRDAQKLLNRETKQAAGRMMFDEEDRCLISQDGTFVLQYYAPGEALPLERNYQEYAPSEGIVHLESKGDNK